MKRKLINLWYILLLLLACSCHKTYSEKVTELVEEWKNREIIYPNQMCFTIQGKDTIWEYPIRNCKYSIISYVDTLGCTSCKLQLQKWKEFAGNLDALTEKIVPIYLFLHPKNENEILFTLKREQFNYPVCIDKADSINKLNHFPSDMLFQTFLLDSANRVIAIGNPIHNPKVRELYLNIIAGKTPLSSVSEQSLTSVSLSKEKIDLNTFPWWEKKETEIVISNTGKVPLLLNDVITSCGCIMVEFSKEPVQPGKFARIRLFYKADHPEHFDKTITIYCNTADTPIKLKITGNAK